MSTLDGPIWSKYSIALNYPARSHFQRTLSKERWVQGWDERYAHQEKKKNEETKRALKRPERGEERRPILEKNCVLPFCSRSGSSTAKKWFEESTRRNWDPWEGQQPFRSNPNGVGDRTTTLRRL